MFQRELQYFIEHQAELVEKYLGKALVIKGEELIGVYNTPIDAYEEAQKEHPLGTFMIQLCEPGASAYTVNISTPEIAV